MIKQTTLAAALVASGIGAASAQTFVTADQPGVTTSVSTGQRVERVFSVTPQPASTTEIERVYTVPMYESYEPTAYDSDAYEAARPLVPTQPIPFEATPAQSAPPLLLGDGGGRPYGQPVDVTPQTDVARLSPMTYSAPTSIDPAPPAEIGFQQESETSRLLLALDETYARRVAELKAKHLVQRKAMLDQFEADAADPQKVIGLAQRMRTALSALDSAHEAMLAVEEQQYTAAMLQVLDTSPPRTQ